MAPLCSLAVNLEDVQLYVFTFLLPCELLAAAAAWSKYRALADSDYLWRVHCASLWQGKYHVNERPGEMSRKHAYYSSLIESEFDFILRQQLTDFDFSFRFRKDAGEEWTSRDPWWKNEEARGIKFNSSGDCKIFPKGHSSSSSAATGTTNGDENSDEDDHTTHVVLRWQLAFVGSRSRNKWHFSKTTRTRNAASECSSHNARLKFFRSMFKAKLESTVEASAPKVEAAAAAAAATGEAQDGRRFSSRLSGLKNSRTESALGEEVLDELADRGDSLVLSVNGIIVPTYRCRRLPNWGFLFESCWAVYTSYKMPKRNEECPLTHDRSMTIDTSDQEDEIDWYHSQLMLHGLDDEDDDDDDFIYADYSEGEDQQG